ncbi:MAG: uracil-DNA glycosylase [Phycisphaeraceae bacterium]
MSITPDANDPRVRRVLRQFVETDALLGVDAVPVSARRVAPAAASAEPAAASRSISTSASAAAERGTKPAAPVSDAAAMTDRSSTFWDEIPATPEEPANREAKLKLLTAMDENEVRGCTRCALCESRTQTVFGEGDVDAQIMFIGEGPGQTEDETGRPFVGRAGQLLDKMIVAMGFSRESVYIANVVKCRPPGNRTPQIEEVSACRSYLLRQVAWIRPKAIVTLGGPATKLILDTQEGITRIRGRWDEFREVDPPIPVMPTFHPAYLLRNYTKETRGKVWSDLLAVLERLGVEPPKQ